MAERENSPIGSGGTGAVCGGMSVMQRNCRSKHHKRLRPIRALHLFPPVMFPPVMFPSVMFPSVKKGCESLNCTLRMNHLPGGGIAAWSRG